MGLNSYYILFLKKRTKPIPKLQTKKYNQESLKSYTLTLINFIILLFNLAHMLN